MDGYFWVCGYDAWVGWARRTGACVRDVGYILGETRGAGWMGLSTSSGKMVVVGLTGC